MNSFPKRTQIYSIEGAVGAGKSTVLTKLDQLCLPGVYCFAEPIDSWQNFPIESRTPPYYKHSMNFLKAFYDNPGKDEGRQLQVYFTLKQMCTLKNETLILFIDRWLFLPQWRKGPEKYTRYRILKLWSWKGLSTLPGEIHIFQITIALVFTLCYTVISVSNPEMCFWSMIISLTRWTEVYWNLWPR